MAPSTAGALSGTRAAHLVRTEAARCARPSILTPLALAGFCAAGPKTQRSPVSLYEPRTADDRAVHIAAGFDHVLILLKNGRVLSFGCAEGGRLGRFPALEAEVAVRDGPPELIRGRLAERLTPAAVTGLPTDIAFVAAVRLHAVLCRTPSHLPRAGRLCQLRRDIRRGGVRVGPK